MQPRAVVPSEVSELASRRRIVSDLRAGVAIEPGAELLVVDDAALHDGAGVLLAAARGLVDPAVALVVLGPHAKRDLLEETGWFLERQGAELSVYRLPWTDDDLAAALWRHDPESAVDVVIRLDDAVDEAARAAYRCAVPGSLEVEVVVGAARPARHLADAAIELVAPAAVFPEPGWIQALLDAVDGGAVGCSLVTSAGTVVHAGASSSGRAIAGGAIAGSDPVPEATATRRRLLPPYARPVTAAAPEPGAVVGAHLGGVAALISPEAAERLAPASLRESLPGAVVVVTDQLVSSEPPPWLAELADTVGPPVVWSDQPVEDGIVEHYGVAGVLVIGPWAGFSAVSGVDLTRWVGATRPAALAYLSAGLLETSFDAAAAHGADATIAWIGEGPCPLPERVDLSCVPTDLAAALGQTMPAPMTPGPRPIGERETVAGLVTVVIPVHGQRHLTEACLDSLRASADISMEVIVVDDASPDDTAAWLATQDDIGTITNDRNLGFAASVNRGIEAAIGELVCVLNNDTEVVPGWMGEMIDQLGEPGVGLVGPRSNAIAGRQMVRSAPPMSDADAARRWGREHAATHAGIGFDVPSMMGLCLLARRELFVALGGLDEGFGLGNGEDDELCERVRRAGLRLRIADGAIVLHHGSATFRSIATDYGSLLLAGNRLAPPRLASRLDRWGIVLSDGQPYGASATVDSLLPLVDRVVVLERGALHPTELAIGNFACLGATVLPVDWRREPVLPIVAGQDVSTLVFEAGELPVYEDWGLVRAELEMLPDGAATLHSANGPSRRVVPVGDDPLDWTGRRSAPVMQTLRVER
ncbi:MAG: glycosyltransferase family 2 protein [Actinomycetota bacterium]